jgi:hypothetical protein
MILQCFVFTFILLTSHCNSHTIDVLDILQVNSTIPSVSISGDVIVVGAPHDASNATGVNGDQSNNNATDSGAAYVFVRNGTSWTQQAYLKASLMLAISLAIQ